VVSDKLALKEITDAVLFGRNALCVLMFCVFGDFDNLNILVGLDRTAGIVAVTSTRFVVLPEEYGLVLCVDCNFQSFHIHVLLGPKELQRLRRRTRHPW
jgi:hypothetical protein